MGVVRAPTTLLSLAPKRELLARGEAVGLLAAVLGSRRDSRGQRDSWQQRGEVKTQASSQWVALLAWSCLIHTMVLKIDGQLLVQQ